MKYLKQSSLVNRSIIGKKSYVSISCSLTETSYKIYSIFNNMTGCFFFRRGEIKKKNMQLLKKKENKYNLHDSKEKILKNI